MLPDCNQLLFFKFNIIFVKFMKKPLALILLLVYFTVSTGFVVSLHYCMNKLDSTQLGVAKDSFCNKCGMETDGSCCWDDVKVVKLPLQHTVTALINAIFSAPVLEINFTEYLFASINNFDPVHYFPVDTGPPLSDQEIYLQNCVFRL